jgi:hypothetical protein
MVIRYGKDNLCPPKSNVSDGILRRLRAIKGHFGAVGTILLQKQEFFDEDDRRPNLTIGYPTVCLGRDPAIRTAKPVSKWDVLKLAQQRGVSFLDQPAMRVELNHHR